jgi:hypothetical protein
MDLHNSIFRLLAPLYATHLDKGKISTNSAKFLNGNSRNCLLGCAKHLTLKIEGKADKKKVLTQTFAYRSTVFVFGCCFFTEETVCCGWPGVICPYCIS